MTPAQPSPRDPSPAVLKPWPGLLCGAVLALGILAIYCRTFSVPLLFDDATSIADNPSIHHLWPLSSVFSPPRDAGVGGRPLLNLTFALNYAIGGTSVLSYHAFNLAVHVLAALTLFALVRGTLLRPALSGLFGSYAAPLALAISAVWAWHPLQTVSVTYVSQRAESMMGLFYLLTLYAFIRGVDATDRVRSRVWFALSVLACLAGVATKQVIVTAPVMALLYDRTFLSGSFARAWRSHRPVYVALALTWIPLGLLMTGLHQGVGTGNGVAWWAYGLTESRVVAHYLVLCLWPHPLVFDYAMNGASTLARSWPYVLVDLLMLAFAAFALVRSPVLGFAACWFLVILAPTSSVVPIIGQPMAENRLYLPLAAVSAVAVLGAYSLLGRRGLIAAYLAAAGLAVLSYQRNETYSSAISLWTDTVAKNPSDPRAYTQLGLALQELPGGLPKAIAEFRTAIAVNPHYPEAHCSLGRALAIEGETPEAIAEFEAALRERSDQVAAHSGLAHLWFAMPNHLDDAVREFREAVRLRPYDPEAHYNLGTALVRVPGRLEEAASEFREALRLNPDDAAAHANLAKALSDLPGHTDEAIAQYREAMRLKPDNAMIHLNLALALLTTQGHRDEAREQLEWVLRLQPQNGKAAQILARLRASQP